MNVRIIGRGKVGRALHAALRKARVASKLHQGRNVPPRSNDGPVIYVLAVPDSQLRATALRVAGRVHPGDAVLHCSGSRGPEELEACQARGAAIAAMHPLVSFASARAVSDLLNTTWIARGDERAISSAKKLAQVLGARCVKGPSGNAAYHAAAVTAGNGSAALADLAVRMLQTLGLNRKVAEQGIAGLLRSVANNIERVGLPAALTGPVVRGDAETVRSHVFAWHALDPALAHDYVALVPLILSTAEGAGLSRGESARVKAALVLDRTAKMALKSKGKRARLHPR